MIYISEGIIHWERIEQGYGTVITLQHGGVFLLDTHLKIQSCITNTNRGEAMAAVVKRMLLQ
jgi:hypothetical protein